jgi:2-polyprenyl-3-methyl-5-hydroxy-6-metoxy-1,4-benzoquinol methylase
MDANPTPDIGSSELYDGYERWKGWNNPFKYSDEEAEYYAGEMRGLRLENAQVFEIGFGSGVFLSWARARGARVAGTEINPALLAAAQNFGVEILPADFETVAGQHDGRFDAIAAFDVFEHFSVGEIVVRLKAIETMLRPEGRVFLRFPNAQSPFGLASQNGDPTHKTGLSRSVFEQLLVTTSLEIVDYAPSYRIRGGSLPKRAVRLTRALLRRAIAASLNFIYTQNIPWDPVVVLVLKKSK